MKIRKLVLNVFKSAGIFIIIGMLFFDFGNSAKFKTSHDMGMIHNYTNDSMECCSLSLPYGMSLGYFAILTTFRDNVDSLNIFFVVVFSFLFIYSLFKSNKYLYRLYFKKIRDRYGSWRIFEKFLNLFRFGIINSKVY